MKKILVLIAAMTLLIGTTSCREEHESMDQEVEVQELQDDVPNDNSSESTYETNPVQDDKP